MTEAAKDTVKLSWGTLMQGSLILATILLSFAYVKARADMNTRDITSHKTEDKEQWTKAFEKIEDNEDDIHAVQVQNGRIEQNQKEILRRIEDGERNDAKRHAEFMSFVSSWELYSDGNKHQ